jgi:hypothetical protein
MFDDVEESSVDVTPDSPDRAIAWAIWSREADLTHEEAWAILHERYPEEPRFLLLNAYAELSESSKRAEGSAAALAPSYLLSKMDRILANASEEVTQRVRELLSFGGLVFAAAKGEDAERLAALRAKLGAEATAPKRDERDRAGLRLRRFEREVLKEIEERTQDNRPLGTRAPAAESKPGSDWQSAVADPNKPRVPYSAEARYSRGDLVAHAKFGVGVVTGTEPGKVVLLFETGPRKLVAKT